MPASGGACSNESSPRAARAVRLTRARPRVRDVGRYRARRRRSVRPTPTRSEASPTRPTSGSGLAVLGRCLAAVGGSSGRRRRGRRRRGDADALAAAPPCCARQRGCHFLLRNHLRRHLGDDRRRQLVAGSEVGQLRRLAVAHDLDSTLVHVPSVNILNPSAVCTMMVGPDTCLTVPFFTSVTVTGCRVVFVVTTAVPFIPGFRS